MVAFCSPLGLISQYLCFVGRYVINAIASEQQQLEAITHRNTAKNVTRAQRRSCVNMQAHKESLRHAEVMVPSSSHQKKGLIPTDRQNNKKKTQLCLLYFKHTRTRTCMHIQWEITQSNSADKATVSTVSVRTSLRWLCVTTERTFSAISGKRVITVYQTSSQMQF